MADPQDAPPQRQAAGRLFGDGILALCILLIVYASLYPFEVWRAPSAMSWANLWSRYYAEFDVFLNFLSYVPLGFLVAASRRHRPGAGTTLAFTVACCAALSFAMEGLQLFLPTRVTSLLDWMANTIGAATGALLGQSPPGAKLRAQAINLRMNLCLTETAVDAGLLLLVIWLLAQINPSVPFFEAGNMVNRLTASWRINPYDPLFLIPQIVGVGLNVCGFALFISILLKSGVRAIYVVAIVLALGLGLKLIAAGLMLKAPLLENWLGPASVLGLALGLFAALPLFSLQRHVRVFIALLLVFAGGLMSKMASIYDGFDAMLRLFDWRHGQLSNFARLTRYLHEVWPLMVLAFLAYCYVRRRAEN